MRALKAALRLYGYNITSIFCSIFIFALSGAKASQKPLIFSLICSVLYIFLNYHIGWNYGRKDGRRIPGSYPDKTFVMKVSLYVSVIPLILLLLRFISPNLLNIDLSFLSDENYGFSGLKISGGMDLIYKLWFLPMSGFMGDGNIFLYVVWILYQPLIFVISYWVGVKKFKFLDFFIRKILYNK